MANGRTSLATVISLQRWQVDTEQRCLHQANAGLQAIDDALAALAQRCADEQHRATAAIEFGGFAFGRFLESVKRRRGELEGQRATALAHVEAARERLAAAYREQRKFELAEAEQRRQAAVSAAKRAQQALDEMAILRHQRNGG